MRKIWPPIYMVGAILHVIGGYKSLSSEQTAHTNVDSAFVSIVFVMTCLFPLVAMAYSRRRGVETFQRPSLDRAPLGWWTDTLQPIRVSWVIAGLLSIGSFFALPKADYKGVMMFWLYAALAMGLFIGERIVYRVYYKRIV